MAMRWILCLVIALSGTCLAAEVYKVVDEQGRVTYTDAPPAEGQQHEPVDLPPINSQPPVRPRARSAPPADDRTEEQVSYSVQLLNPPDGAQVPPGQRDLHLLARTTPALEDGAYLQFLLNGEPVAPPSQSTNAIIEEIYRGAHKVSARVVDSRGRVLATSPPVEVFVHRPTLNSPARRAP